MAVVPPKKIIVKKILVNNCHECPFANNDNEYGKDGCNLNLDITVDNFEELPSNTVHEECPLLGNYDILLIMANINESTQ